MSNNTRTTNTISTTERYTMDSEFKGAASTEAFINSKFANFSLGIRTQNSTSMSDQTLLSNYIKIWESDGKENTDQWYSALPDAKYEYTALHTVHIPTEDIIAPTDVRIVENDYNVTNTNSTLLLCSDVTRGLLTTTPASVIDKKYVYGFDSKRNIPRYRLELVSSTDTAATVKKSIFNSYKFIMDILKNKTSTITTPCGGTPLNPITLSYSKTGSDLTHTYDAVYLSDNGSVNVSTKDGSNSVVFGLLSTSTPTMKLVNDSKYTISNNGMYLLYIDTERKLIQLYVNMVNTSNFMTLQDKNKYIPSIIYSNYCNTVEPKDLTSHSLSIYTVEPRCNCNMGTVVLTAKKLIGVPAIDSIVQCLRGCAGNLTIANERNTFAGDILYNSSGESTCPTYIQACVQTIELDGSTVNTVKSACDFTKQTTTPSTTQSSTTSSDPSSNTTPTTSTTKISTTKLIIIIVGSVVFIGICVSVYLYYRNKNNKENTANTH